ncbi:MAG TPA: 2-carboxy-1,4-naphthoquinone phytyltransferase [Oculatellaceae cyanobacterium]|jgi:1,4-dihydroxy-2-naphthoate octaprenyltransferase
MTTIIIEQPNRKLWLAAIKPPMYTVAVIPIWVGSTIAFAQTKIFNIQIFAVFLTSAILFIAWMNVSNDVFDDDTGIDQNKAHSVVKLTGNKSLTFWIANLCLITGILGVSLISWWQRDITVMVLVLVASAIAYTYQGPPFRLGYQGLGEIICLICFSMVVVAAYYSQAQTWSIVSFAAAMIVAIATSLILFCSHIHQVKDDLAAGKRSPIVRLGTKKASQILPWFGGSIYALTALFVVLRIFPVATLLVFLSLPLAIKLFRHVHNYHDQPAKVSNSKFIAVAMHFLMGSLLGVGFLIN